MSIDANEDSQAVVGALGVIADAGQPEALAEPITSRPDLTGERP